MDFILDSPESTADRLIVLLAFIVVEFQDEAVKQLRAGDSVETVKAMAATQRAKNICILIAHS